MIAVRDRFTDVRANLQRLQIVNRLAAVVPVVGDHFLNHRDRAFGDLVDRFELLSGLRLRFLNRGARPGRRPAPLVPTIAPVSRSIAYSALCAGGSAALHLRDLRVGIVRMFRRIVRIPFSCAFDPRQIGACRRPIPHAVASFVKNSS